MGAASRLQRLARFPLFMAVLAVAPNLRADELEEISLEDLLEMEIDVAARKARTIRESPGVVTLIRREEIVASGARDITDLLLRVPGIAFGMDVNGVVGIGMRGIWAHEGKVLLLIDGQEMNENLYTSTQWGHHIPLDSVERIEIIRGPGSAIYGGFAELAVINVLTRRGASLNGGDVSVAYGQTAKDFGHRTASVAYGRKLESGLDFSISGAFGQGVRSDRRFEDFYGDSFDMTKGATLQSAFADLGVSWKGASLRYIFDDYRMLTQDGFDIVSPEPYDQTFTSHLAEVLYDAKVGPVTVTPKLNYRRQVPWQTLQKSDDAPFYDKTVERFTGGLIGSWDPTPALNVLLAGEAYQDHAFLNDDELVGFQTEFANGKKEVSYENVAAYSQVLWDTRLANIAVGARYENHSEFGDSFVPRAALTRVFDRLHVKLLYSNAFRAPGIENLRVSNEEVTPERTTVYEAEAGYRIAPGIFATANVFDITIEDPIVYFYDEDIGEDYVNYPQTGSRGAEVEVRTASDHFHATVGVSVYDAAGKNEVPVYDAGSRSPLLGMPQLKLVANGGADLADTVGLDLSAVLLGPRRGYLRGDDEGGSVIEESDPVLLFDVFVRWRDAGLKRLDVGVGIYNLFDADYRLIQPYAGGHAPLPTTRREGLVRLTYAY